MVLAFFLDIRLPIHHQATLCRATIRDQEDREEDQGHLSRGIEEGKVIRINSNRRIRIRFRLIQCRGRYRLNLSRRKR